MHKSMLLSPFLVSLSNILPHTKLHLESGFLGKRIELDDVKRNIRTELWEIIFKIVRRIYKLDFEIKGCLLTSAF
ncbi:hypothetical protein RhiirA1_454331 [Rhizophagus irregularis]|uniref:Uncharacterized protein n=1 Tax=Rhizophagus irregularis TaxID=588596 RepID=A0A2N0S5B9_9GLOM|nr:hypothetical protein RhiirA1_454331 [Rhizophagus irregularis]